MEINNFFKNRAETKKFGVDKLGFNFVVNKNWGKENFKHVVLLTGIPEKAGQLTDKENLNLLFDQKLAVCQVYYDGFLVDKNKSSKLRESTKKAIFSAKDNPMIIAYSAGALNLTNFSDDEINKVSQVVLINPFLGDKIISDKLRVVGKILPKTDMVINELRVGLEKLARLNKLKVITSNKDDLLNSEAIVNLLGKFLPKEMFSERNGDHGITQQELLNIINN